MSFPGFAEFWGSGSSVLRDAPEARPAGLEEAEGKTKQPVKMPFSLQEIKPNHLEQKDSKSRVTWTLQQLCTIQNNCVL